jgi:DNA processing protein
LAGPVTPPLVLPLGRLVEPEPASHAGLYRRTRWDGLLVSEHGTQLPDELTAADRHRQGHLMAALVRGLVLVEPGWGSRWLVDAAEAAGVPVLAVPGSIGSEQSQGAHELIRDGRARLVVGVVDILDRLSRGGR